MGEVTSYGPAFRWFAWRPAWTDDRGWRWLRPVWRRRLYLDLMGQPAMAWFVHSVDRAEHEPPTPDPDAALRAGLTEQGGDQ